MKDSTRRLASDFETRTFHFDRVVSGFEKGNKRISVVYNKVPEYMNEKGWKVLKLAKGQKGAIKMRAMFSDSIGMFTRFFKKEKPAWRTKQVEEFIEEFSIWAKHTDNQEWVGFAEKKLDQIAKEKDRPSEEFILEELIKMQNTIRSIKFE